MSITPPSACWIGWHRVRRVLAPGVLLIIESSCTAPRGWGSA